MEVHNEGRAGPIFAKWPRLRLRWTQRQLRAPIPDIREFQWIPQKRTTSAPKEIIDIALRAPAGYRGIVFRILTLVLLVSALVVPRAAWGAHLSGHDDLSSVGAVHSHNDDHAHEHSATDEDAAEQDDAPGDLTHDHKPAFAVGGDIPLPEISSVNAIIGARSADAPVELHLTVLSRPGSLLRPPRAI